MNFELVFVFFFSLVSVCLFLLLWMVSRTEGRGARMWMGLELSDV